MTPRSVRGGAGPRIAAARGRIERPVEPEHRHVLVVGDLRRRPIIPRPGGFARLFGPDAELLGRLPEAGDHVLVVPVVESLPPLPAASNRCERAVGSALADEIDPVREVGPVKRVLARDHGCDAGVADVTRPDERGVLGIAARAGLVAAVEVDALRVVSDPDREPDDRGDADRYHPAGRAP